MTRASIFPIILIEVGSSSQSAHLLAALAFAFARRCSNELSGIILGMPQPIRKRTFAGNALSALLNPLNQRVLRILPEFRIRMIDEKYYDPFLAVLRTHVASNGFDAFQRAGFQMGMAGRRTFPEAFFYRAVHTENGQRSP